MSEEDMTMPSYDIVIRAPEGFIFSECSNCKNPYCDDGSSDKCIFCTIGVEL